MVVVLAILPIFGLITLGYLFGWRRWLTNEGAAGLASVTFKLFMPAVLFTGIARAELSDGMSPMLLLGYFVPVLLVFLLVNWSLTAAPGGPRRLVSRPPTRTMCWSASRW